jgi:hypothetical protein
MPPRLEAVYFGTKPSWRRMAAVLDATAAAHCPDWSRSVRAITPAAHRSAAGPEFVGHVSNTQKLEVWVRLVEEAADGTELLLLDADTAINRPLDPIWAQDFDLAFATKQAPFPCNLGVVFVRVSDRIRTLFRAWWAENVALLADRRPRVWIKQYGGINQSAFCRIREAGALEGLAVAELACLEWNCEDSTWAAFDPAVTRIVHVKGALRRALFEPPLRAQAHLAPLVHWWRETEARVTAPTERSA